MAIETLSQLFLDVVERDKSDCMLHKVGGEWIPISSQQLLDSVQRLATAMKRFGIRRGDRVALMAENGPHWPIVDFSTLCLGGVLVPIYPTLTQDQAAYIAKDCGAKVVFVQGIARLEALLDERDMLSGVERYVLIDERSTLPDIPTLAELLSQSEPMTREELEEEARTARPDDLATFIYTSGTTGNPKGVMLTHGNIASNASNTHDHLPFGKDWTTLCFLPLSHSFERTADYVFFMRGFTIAYAESVQAVPQNLLEVRPHTFVSVPRVYEKFFSKVQESVAASSPLKQRIFQWARQTAREALPYRLRRQHPGGLLGVRLSLADRLVFGKIKARFGDRLHFVISGGAPLSQDLAEFFWGAGIEIYEGYGLSETSPVLAANQPGATKLGTVGKAIPQTELRIAEDGEILARGPQIMRGYHNLPADSAEAIDDQGWFHTGDIGEIDAEGFLKITDRKKEIIVNAYGKNVAPAPVENALKSSRFISQAVVVGDRRQFLAAVLVPDFESLRSWCEQQALTTADLETLLTEKQVRDLYAVEVAAVNAELARYEQIRAWRLIPHEFTIETGELTPTQKIKRRVINQKYGALIEAMYEEAEKAFAKPAG